MGKRVLMLLENESYPDDGRVRREAATLQDAGCSVYVISPAVPGQPKRLNVGGVEAYRYRAPAAGDGLWGYVWEYGYSLAASLLLALRIFARHRFDVIHAHNPPDLFVLIALLFRPLGVKFVFDHHDLAPEMYHARFPDRSSGRVYRALLAFERLSSRVADRIITTNESYRRWHIERHAAPAEKIAVVRNGPDLDRFKLLEPDAALRDRAGTIIGYVGVMGIQDGLDYLLRALRHLIDDFGKSDFFCVLIGDGAARPGLEQLAAELDLQKHVLFTGILTGEPLLRHLSAADICVVPDPSNPYNDRSTMIKTMEYMALQKPVVAFDMPEHRASADGAALYAEPNDERDFAHKIGILIDAPEKRRQMGKIGLQRVQTELAWAFQSRRLIQVYRDLGVLPHDPTSRSGASAESSGRG